MDLSELESFIATVCAGSFSAAARGLGIPKSTVANRVDALETRLGTRLVERTTRAVRPTAEGSLLWQRGEALLQEARDLEQAFREHGGQPRGKLRVSVPVLFEQEFMGEVAAACLAKYPEMQIEAVPDDRRADLVGEAFDCAIRTGALDDSTAHARVFAQARNVVVAAPALVERHGTPRAPSDLSAWPVVWYGPDTPGDKAWALFHDGRPTPVTVQPRAFLGSLRSARAAALAGVGAALLPDFLLAPDLEAGRLRVVGPEWAAPSVPLSVVYPAHKQPSPRMRAFIDVLLERFRVRALAIGPDGAEEQNGGGEHHAALES